MVLLHKGLLFTTDVMIGRNAKFMWAHERRKFVFLEDPEYSMLSSRPERQNNRHILLDTYSFGIWRCSASTNRRMPFSLDIVYLNMYVDCRYSYKLQNKNGYASYIIQIHVALTTSAASILVCSRFERNTPSKLVIDLIGFSRYIHPYKFTAMSLWSMYTVHRAIIGVANVDSISDMAIMQHPLVNVNTINACAYMCMCLCAYKICLIIQIFPVVATSISGIKTNHFHVIKRYLYAYLYVYIKSKYSIKATNYKTRRGYQRTRERDKSPKSHLST